ncbi:unnamed protein product [Lepidochelys kempii]
MKGEPWSPAMENKRGSKKRGDSRPGAESRSLSCLVEAYAALKLLGRDSVIAAAGECVSSSLATPGSLQRVGTAPRLGVVWGGGSGEREGNQAGAAAAGFDLVVTPPRKPSTKKNAALLLLLC